MSRRAFFQGEQRLAERLRREADQSRPEFSEALHSRVCRAVRGLGGAGISGLDHASRVAPLRPDGARTVVRQKPRWLPAAAAAACLLGAAIVVWQLRHTPRTPDVAATGPGLDRAQSGRNNSDAGLAGPGKALHAVTGLAGDMSGEIHRWLDSAMASRQWAYLDHDARITVHMLASRLPFDVASSLALSDAPPGP